MLHLVQNILLGVSLAAPIGPCNLAIIKRGLRYGFFPAILVGLGVVVADATYLLLIYFGLSHIINTPHVRTIIWFFGAVVLLYLGYRSVKEYFEEIRMEGSELKTGGNSFIIGFMVNISNPMSIVWWVGVFGSVISSSVHESSQTVALLNSSTILVGVMAWHSSVAALLHWGRRFVTVSMMRYVSLIFGFVLLGFSCYFCYNALISL